MSVDLNRENMPGNGNASRDQTSARIDSKRVRCLREGAIEGASTGVLGSDRDLMTLWPEESKETAPSFLMHLASAS